jgi:hypothetical protein
MQMSGEGFWKKHNSTFTHHSKHKYSNDDFYHQMSHCDGDGHNETNGRLFNGDGAIKEKCFVENRTYNNTNIAQHAQQHAQHAQHAQQHAQQYCNNCGKHGHLFSNCVVPITSLGIIACRKKKQTKNETTSDLDANIIDGTVSTIDDAISHNQFEYLMIQRIDSFGYI